MLVIKLNSTGTSLGNGEVTCLGLDVLYFVPPLLGHMLGHQGVGGLDSWEFSRHGFCMARTSSVCIVCSAKYFILH